MVKHLLDEEKLYRLLYLTQNRPEYVAGDPENYFLKDASVNLELVKDLTSNDEKLVTFIKCIERASSDPCLPRRVTLFYVLAFALSQSNSDGNSRRDLAEKILTICKTDEELFKFISIFTKFRSNINGNKITTAVGHAVNKFINKKTCHQYAKEVGKTKGYHGWKYKDLIKLSHFKSTSAEKTLITSYVLFGLDRLKGQKSADMKKIYALLEKHDRLKKTDDENEASALVRELHANFSQVNPKFVKSQKVWSSVIPELPVREVLTLLPRLYKYGLIKDGSRVHAKLIEAVTSHERIKNCKLHPLEVFIHIKNFSEGGKPLDPTFEEYLKSKNASEIAKGRSQPDCPIITKSLWKCFNLSFPKNYFRSKANIVLALDVTGISEPVCFKNKNITCLEAQLALASYYCRTRKDVSVTIYQNSDVKEFNLDKNASFCDNLRRLRDNKSDYLWLPSVFDWAIKKQQKVDMFICFVQTVSALFSVPKNEKTSWSKALKNKFLEYQQRMSSPSTKLVLICLGSNNLAGFDDIQELSICGFCPEIPNVIQAFARGSFK